MYIMFIVYSWPAFCHAAYKRRLIDFVVRVTYMCRWCHAHSCHVFSFSMLSSCSRKPISKQHNATKECNGLNNVLQVQRYTVLIKIIDLASIRPADR